MNWKYTNIQHGARIAIGVSPNEYCVADIIYKSQTHPGFSRDGWTDIGAHKLAEFMDFSTGTIHKMMEKFNEMGLLEFGKTKRLKRMLPTWYNVAYLDDEAANEITVQKVNVQKVNADRSKSERSTVQKVNGSRSKSEHININKEKDKLKESEPRAPEPPKKEEKPVIAQQIELLIKENPQVSPAELKVFVLKEAIKDHFNKYPLNRDLYTTGLTPVPTSREFLEQIDIYVRHYSAESVPGYQFFINDPVAHIPKTFPKWLRRWASGKRDELRRSGATSGVYEKPKI